MNCGLKFGLESALNLTGRHHCRLCGVSVCGDCCQPMLYVGLAGIVNHEGDFNQDDAVRVCEYCINDVFKLKEKVDQKETDMVLISLYSRFYKSKTTLENLQGKLVFQVNQPIAFKV
jgi:hypothetical protein